MIVVDIWKSEELASCRKRLRWFIMCQTWCYYCFPREPSPWRDDRFCGPSERENLTTGDGYHKQENFESTIRSHFLLRGICASATCVHNRRLRRTNRRIHFYILFDSVEMRILKIFPKIENPLSASSYSVRGPSRMEFIISMSNR